MPQRLSDSFKHMTPGQRSMYLVIGAGLCLVPAVSLLVHGVHGWLDFAVYGLFFVVGLFIAMPDKTLLLLQATGGFMQKIPLSWRKNAK